MFMLKKDKKEIDIFQMQWTKSVLVFKTSQNIVVIKKLAWTGNV